MDASHSDLSGETARAVVSDGENNMAVEGPTHADFLVQNGEMDNGHVDGASDRPAEEAAALADFSFSAHPTLEDIRRMQEEFSRERNWDQYHQPRNLLLALVGEVGELAELFQWKGEVREGLPGWSPEEREHLGQELSDVLIYLVRLADKCRVDLPKAVVDKIRLNRAKYPPSRVWGSSKKYTQYASTNK